MSKNKLWLIIAIVAIGLVGSASFAAEDVITVPIFDHDGRLIPPGSNVPYSPKMTCGGCHHLNCEQPGPGNQNPRGWCTTRPTNPDGSLKLDQINFSDYEELTGYATKDHGTSNQYQTPYPKHGVSASRHSQQGRNITFGNLQRSYYGAPPFQPSVGQYGEWDIFTNMHLAHLTENDPKKFDMSSYNFAYSFCGWCHPGGGPLEYDRAGYRYDGRRGLHYPAGFNPHRDAHKGDYYVFENGQIVSRVQDWEDKGVAEVDCLVCHLPHQVARYAMHERNAVHSEIGGYNPTGGAAPTLKGLKYSATIGLARTGLLNDITVGAPLTNPSLSNWKWPNEGTHVRVPRAAVNFTEQETCSNCHFPDLSDGTLGPLALPLGATHFQKIILPGQSDDSDEITGDGKNNDIWIAVLPRIQGLKRGTTINFPQNPDVHHDVKQLGNVKHQPDAWGRTRCSTCHYQVTGNFGPVKDATGNVVLPAVTVKLMDHQFAKGQSFPDTDDMDQLDGTITCKTCHIDKTHPEQRLNARAPVPLHRGFPSIHFNKIDCKTCHIPVLNGLTHLYLIDYSTGPYRGTLRVDAAVAIGDHLGNSGIVPPGTFQFDNGAALKPLYMWQKRKEGMRIVPTNPVVSAIWFDGNKPTIQRAAFGAAQELRQLIGDQNNDGVYDFALNRRKSTANNHHLTESTLIARTVDEIIGMANMLNSEAVANAYRFERVRDPILNLGVNLYSISHNVMPLTRDAQGRVIPGDLVTYTTGTGQTFSRRTGPLGINGCIECHSSSNPNSPNYSPASVGFFDKEHVLFRPVEGGVKQVVANIGGSGEKRRVRFVIDKLKKEDGSDHSVDLTLRTNHGDSIPNTVNQAAILGYSAEKLAKLTSPIGTTKPQARLRVTRVKDNPATTPDESERGLKVKFTNVSLCPSGNCTSVLKVDTVSDATCDARVTVPLTNNEAEYTFSLNRGVWNGSFCAQLSVTDNHTGLNSTRTFPINLTKRNTKPNIEANIEALADKRAKVTFTVNDDDDETGQIRVLIVWGHDVPQEVAGSVGSVTKTDPYPNVTRTYNVRVTAIDSKGGRTRVTVPVTITATP